VFSGKSTTCVSCHQADYDATTEPSHRTAQFGTSCETCHSTAGWRGASFNHDAAFFPIYSGPHRGEWNNCSTCHTSAASYKQFTCLSCHEHNKTEMDAKHRERNGYVYASPNCLSCHPRGRE
jgi:hypothetical protein